MSSLLGRAFLEAISLGTISLGTIALGTIALETISEKSAKQAPESIEGFYHRDGKARYGPAGLSGGLQSQQTQTIRLAAEGTENTECWKQGVLCTLCGKKFRIYATLQLSRLLSHSDSFPLRVKCELA